MVIKRCHAYEKEMQPAYSLLMEIIAIIDILVFYIL